MGQSEYNEYRSWNLLGRRHGFDGKTTDYNYDSEGRVVEEVTGTMTSQYDYDAAGRLLSGTQITNGVPQTARYSYDSDDRLVKETKPEGDVLEYAYDAGGNKTLFKLTTPDGLVKTVTYAYDALNRLTHITDHTGTTVISYNPVGNKLSETRPNGVTTEYAYDARNRLVNMTHRQGTTILARFSYVLDAAGQRVGLTEQDGRTSQWQYDSLGRLVQESTGRNGKTSTTRYELDAVGNRLKQIKDGLETIYSYDDNDRLTSEGTAGSSTSYLYDAGGNLRSEVKNGLSKVYAYNNKQQLVKAGDTEFAYDIAGNRTLSTTGSNSTRFVVDANQPYAQVVMEKENGQPAATYTYGDDLLSQSRGGGSQYFVYDALGSTRGLTDSTGRLTDSYEYSAYGELTGKTGSSKNSYLYTGERFDENLSQYYLRARYYSPANGRFSQMDSWLGSAYQPVTANKYLYANASPAMFTDPSGRTSLSEISVGLNMQSILTMGAISTSYMVIRTINIITDDLSSISVNPTEVGVITLAVLSNTNLTISKTRVEVKENTKTKQYVAREAWFTGRPNSSSTYLMFGRKLTFQEAVLEVNFQLDVIGNRQQISKNIAFVAGGGRAPVGPEIHGNNWNYRGHYHTWDRNGSHIFFWEILWELLRVIFA